MKPAESFSALSSQRRQNVFLHQDPWLCELPSDGRHEQPLSEVVEALAPNILVHFLSLLHHGTSLHNTLSTCLWFVQLQSNFRQSLTGWIHSRCGWNFWVIDLTSWQSCLEFPFEFTASNSTYMPSSCCCLSTLSFLCTSTFSCWYRFLSLPFASLFSLIAAKVSSDIHYFIFCDFTHPIAV